MNELTAVFRKEMLEILGDRQSRRGGLIQGTVLILLLGVFAVKPDLWQSQDPKAIVLFAFLPGVASAAVAADAFAGERERRTLDTLLASPLDERTILFGKAAAAVVFGFLVGALGLVATMITLNVALGGYVPSIAALGAVLGASFTSALLVASVAIVVSMFVPVARAAQQIASICSALLLALGVFAWEASHAPRTWAFAYLAEGLVALVALAVLEVARASFRRDRFYGV